MPSQTPTTVTEAASASSGTVAHAGDVAKNVAEAVPMPMETVFNWSGYFQAIGSLALLLAVLWLVVWILRKYGRFNFIPRPGTFPKDGLRLETQLPLGPRKGLMVVRFLDKRLLLGVTEHQITLLKEVSDNDASESTNFQEIMEDIQRQNPDE